MFVPASFKIFNTIQVKNSENEVVPSATIEFFNSTNKKIVGLVANQQGAAIVLPDYVKDKGGKIVVTSVGYAPLTIPISSFDGKAILQKNEVELEEVVVVGKTKKRKPQEEVVKKDPPKKRKSPVVPIVLGGIGLGALILLLTKVKMK